MTRGNDPPNLISDIAWAAAIALILEDLIEVRWWHPYCNAPASGPGYTGFGFPLPYAQPLGVSLDYVFMPHVLLINVALIALPLFPLLRFLLRGLRSRSTGLARIANVAGPLLLLAVITIYAIVMTPGFSAVSSIAVRDDGYASYRPANWAARAGDKACYI